MKKEKIFWFATSLLKIRVVRKAATVKQIGGFHPEKAAALTGRRQERIVPEDQTERPPTGEVAPRADDAFAQSDRQEDPPLGGPGPLRWNAISS
jgi:hypothetical protein